MNSFCWNLRDDRANFIDSSFKPGQNLSKHEKGGSTKINAQQTQTFLRQ